MASHIFTKDTCFEIREDLVVERVDDDCLVLDLRNNEYYGLNSVARRVWSFLEKQATFRDIAAAINAEFSSVPRERIEQDIELFLREAVSAGIVREVAA